MLKNVSSIGQELWDNFGRFAEKRITYLPKIKVDFVLLLNDHGHQGMEVLMFNVETS